MSDLPTPNRPFEPQARWREGNPEKVWAQRALRSAVKMGIVTPQPCRICGVEPAEAHHPDYTQPRPLSLGCAAGPTTRPSMPA